MNSIGYEIRRAWTSLSNALGFATTVVLTLGMALAALVCVFGLNWLLLVKPFPYPDQDQLVYIKGQSVKGRVVAMDDVHVYPVMTQLYRKTEDFSSVALISYDDNVIENLADTPRMDITYVTPEYFTLLGTPMALGRGFNAEEGLSDEVPVAVISYETWQRYFSGSKEVIGQRIALGKTSFSIVGVVAEHFEEPELANNTWGTQLWLPWDFNERRLYSNAENDWSSYYTDTKLIAKLRTGEPSSSSLYALSERITRWLGKIQYDNTTDPALRKYRSVLEVQPLKEKILGESYVISLLMLAGAFTLLCIAGTNITNLFFARNAQVQRDFAIHSALGAKPRDLFRLMFFESLLVMVIAAILAGIVAVPGMQLLVWLGADHFPRIHTLQFGWVEVLFLLFSAVTLAVFFAWLVSRQINYRLLINSLQSSGKGGGLQISKRTRQGLIISQVVLAAVLLTSTLTLFSQSLQLWLTPTSVTMQDRFLLRVNVRQDNDSRLSTAELMQEIKTGLEKNVNLATISHSESWPYSGFSELVAQRQGDENTFSIVGSGIDENWITLFDVKLLKGRAFGSSDVDDQAQILLVNRAAAELLAYEEEPLGYRIFRLSANKYYEIVGVVENSTIPGQEVKPALYYPSPPENRNFSVEVVAGQKLERNQFSHLLDQINRRYYVSHLLDWGQFYDNKLARDRLIVGVSLAVSLLTLFLIGIGLYGILSYHIRLRRYELGIRMAIGAKPGGILKFIVIDTLIPTIIGLAGGLFVGMGLFWIYHTEIASLISNAYIAWVLPSVVSVTFILCVVLLTCYLPLRYLISRPPIVALREASSE